MSKPPAVAMLQCEALASRGADIPGTMGAVKLSDEHGARAASADAWRIVSARGLRQFGYGMLGVTLAVALSDGGLSPVAIGALITISLIGDFCATYLIAIMADRWGRRRTLVWLALIMAATGAVFALTRFYPLLALAAFFGTLGTPGSETAPFLPLDQAILPQTTPPEGRTALFACYNLIASLAGALGALAGGAPDLLARVGMSRALAVDLVFGVYSLVALGVAALSASLSPRVEPPATAASPSAAAANVAAGWRRLFPPLGSSRSIILRLAGLFSVDAFAGALITQGLLSLYFHLRFGATLGDLGLLFFGANLLSAHSFLLAAPLARRIGLLNTMVFTHLPSNILMILVAFAPAYPLASALLLARQSLSQMDVPTRQAYTMALTPPEERTAAASVTSLARSAGSGVSPVIAGALLAPALVALGLPLLISGGLKVVYDLAVWAVFRNVHPPEERSRGGSLRS